MITPLPGAKSNSFIVNQGSTRAEPIRRKPIKAKACPRPVPIKVKSPETPSKIVPNIAMPRIRLALAIAQARGWTAESKGICIICQIRTASAIPAPKKASPIPDNHHSGRKLNVPDTRAP